MATQPASLRTNHRRIPAAPLHRKRRQSLRRAQDLYECIDCMRKELLDVNDFRMLHRYLSQFLALPPDVLAEWEQSWLRSES